MERRIRGELTLREALQELDKGNEVNIWRTETMKRKRKKRCHANGKIILWPGRMDRCQKSDCKRCRCYY